MTLTTRRKQFLECRDTLIKVIGLSFDEANKFLLSKQKFAKLAEPTRWAKTHEVSK